jgi:prephenate dehydrogenase
MKFGTIGAGTVALAFAREALATGHEVVLSSRRGPEALAGKVAELGHGAFAATVEAAASLDYVLLAVPWPNVEEALRGFPPMPVEWAVGCFVRFQEVDRGTPVTAMGALPQLVKTCLSHQIGESPFHRDFGTRCVSAPNRDPSANRE